jgi:hypothetical protein
MFTTDDPVRERPPEQRWRVCEWWESARARLGFAEVYRGPHHSEDLLDRLRAAGEK